MVMALSLPLTARSTVPCLTAQRALLSCRRYTTQQRIENWAADLRTKRLEFTEEFNNARLQQLFATLPSRNPLQEGYEHPIGIPLPYGFHLAFFGRPSPEESLRSDGTDADFCPPEPFSRRVWASGRMEWPRALACAVHRRGRAAVSIKDVRLRGFRQGNPIVFVDQFLGIAYENEGHEEFEVVQEVRTHAYLPPQSASRRVKRVDDLPQTIDFSYSYTPTPTTLFRFSALTFNGHYIHLDKDYARSEGYEERLVHGPLNALMMLETVCMNDPTCMFRSYEYRAINPVVVNRPIAINGKWTPKGAILWLTQDGVVGMTGSVVMHETRIPPA